MMAFAPRALLRQMRITVALSPLELSLLVAALERRACEAADDPDMVDFAQFLFCRVAELREAGR
jgi:hypothetical protein